LLGLGAERPKGGLDMPESWSSKDERQYEHIKESAAKKGRSSKRAKEIAAATVNKQRAEEGRTKTKSSKSSTSKSGGKKTTARKSTARKSTAKKTTARKTSSRRSTSRKTTTKKR
jgi:hypothetical protein